MEHGARPADAPHPAPVWRGAPPLRPRQVRQRRCAQDRFSELAKARDVDVASGRPGRDELRHSSLRNARRSRMPSRPGRPDARRRDDLRHSSLRNAKRSRKPSQFGRPDGWNLSEVLTMVKVSRILKDYRDAGAVHSLIALWGFVDAHTFLTK